MHVSIRYLRGALLALLGLLLASPLPAAANTLEKNQLGQLLDGHVDDLARGGSLRLTSPTLGPVIVESTLHRFLQQHTMEMLRGVKSRRAAVVVMEADTGRVLVLAGMKAGRLDPEVALEADAPAASLFKIVTAAAALERTRIDPDSELRYTGRPHTLYKNQVSDRGKAKGQKVSLKKGFADSNNPIFARLGMQQLGAELLTSYAKALGFERPLPFEVPVAQSNLPPVRDQFNLAELACGYHRETTISPLHAAVLVSIFLNDGRVLEPYMVRQVSGMGGEVLYQGRTKAHTTPLSKTTCQEMQELFEATVSMGTARRAFNKVDKDKVLRKMELGRQDRHPARPGPHRALRVVRRLRPRPRHRPHPRRGHPGRPRPDPPGQPQGHGPPGPDRSLQGLLQWRPVPLQRPRRPAAPRPHQPSGGAQGRPSGPRRRRPLGYLGQPRIDEARSHPGTPGWDLAARWPGRPPAGSFLFPPRCPTP